MRPRFRQSTFLISTLQLWVFLTLPTNPPSKELPYQKSAILTSKTVQISSSISRPRDPGESIFKKFLRFEFLQILRSPLTKLTPAIIPYQESESAGGAVVVRVGKNWTPNDDDVIEVSYMNSRSSGGLPAQSTTCWLNFLCRWLWYS